MRADGARVISLTVYVILIVFDTLDICHCLMQRSHKVS